MKSAKAYSKLSKPNLSSKPNPAKNKSKHHMLVDQLVPSRIMLFLAMMALVYQFGMVFVGYVNESTMAVGFPFQLDYGEGPVLDQTLRLAHFENIYHNSFSSPPYTVSNYPPLYMLVQVPLFWIFGPAFWYGRLISILCVFIAAIFISLTIFNLVHEWIGSVTGGLLLISFPYVREWSAFNRVDELALALSWAALFVTVRYVGRTDDRRMPRWGFWLAASLFIASIFARQTYALAGPFAAVAWLAFGTRGTWRSRIELAGKFGLAVGGTTLAMFLVLNVVTGGGFYLNIVTANINAFYWQLVQAWAKQIIHSLYPLLILALLFLLFERWIIKERTRIWPLVLFYTLAASAGSVTIGKIGSNMNYLLEFCAALSLASGSALAWISRLKWHGKIWLQILIAVILAFQLSSIRTGYNEQMNFLADRVANIDNDKRLMQIVKNSRGIVLGDEYMGLMPLVGKRLYYQPFEFKQLFDANIVNETSFLRDIRDCKFDVILLQNSKLVKERWTPAQLNALHSSYRLDEVINNVFVLRPNK